MSLCPVSVLNCAILLFIICFLTTSLCSISPLNHPHRLCPLRIYNCSRESRKGIIQNREFFRVIDRVVYVSEQIKKNHIYHKKELPSVLNSKNIENISGKIVNILKLLVTQNKFFLGFSPSVQNFFVIYYHLYLLIKQKQEVTILVSR